MNNTQPFLWRKGLILSATFFLSAAFLFSCKKKDNLLGQSAVDPNELLNSGGIDTFQLVTFSIQEDSVISDNPAYALLGSYNDPVFGEFSAEFYTQFRLSGFDPNFGDLSSISVDSFVLGLEYTGYYGASGNQDLEVFELSEDLHIDSTYYSFSSKSTTGGNLVEAGKENINFNTSNLTVVGSDTIDSQLRIYLDTNKAWDLINKANLSDGTFSSNENFLNYFKGLRIKTNNPPQASGSGGVFYFNLEDPLSKLTIYYMQNGVPKTFDFLINSECADFNHVEIDSSGTDVANVINDTISGMDQYYAQSFGTRAVIQIPGLSNITSSSVVHKAVLEIPVSYLSGSKYTPPGLAVLTRKEKNSEALYSTGIIASYDDYKKAYVIDVRSFVQAVVNKEIENTEIILSPLLFITSAERVIFNGPNTANKTKPKLSIIYTEF